MAWAALVLGPPLVAEQVSAQWVMDARRANAAEGVRQEDVA